MYIKSSEKTNKNNAFGGTLSLSKLSLSILNREMLYYAQVLYLITQKRTNLKSGKFEAKTQKKKINSVCVVFCSACLFLVF